MVPGLNSEPWACLGKYCTNWTASLAHCLSFKEKKIPRNLVMATKQLMSNLLPRSPPFIHCAVLHLWARWGSLWHSEHQSYWSPPSKGCLKCIQDSLLSLYEGGTHARGTVLWRSLFITTAWTTKRLSKHHKRRTHLR